MKLPVVIFLLAALLAVPTGVVLAQDSEAGTVEKAELVSPTPGSTLPGGTVTFTWTAGQNVWTPSSSPGPPARACRAMPSGWVRPPEAMRHTSVLSTTSRWRSTTSQRTAAPSTYDSFPVSRAAGRTTSSRWVRALEVRSTSAVGCSRLYRRGDQPCDGRQPHLRATLFTFPERLGVH